MRKHRICIAVLFVLAILAAFTSCSKAQEKTASSAKEAGPVDDACRNYYEIYVGSFFDTDNDGIGDLNGVTAKLDYIKDMGFNGIWLMPVTKGTSYHKYDVEDYYDVDPQFGNLDDMKKLVSEAHARGIDIIIDLVVNHSSSSHPWFKAACEYLVSHGQPGGPYGEYYNFSQTQKQGYQRVPGSAWYYECQFTGTMPDLNLDSPALRSEVESIMRFWLSDVDVDGFRLDAVTSFYTNSTQKSIEFLSFLNTTAKAIKSDCYIVGEAWLGNNTAVREYYASGIDSFFCFPLAMGTGRVADVLKDIRSTPGKTLGELMTELDQIYDTGILAPFLSNHDTARIASFTGRSQTDKIKMSQGILSLMSGSLFVYYGEEIGMISTSDGADTYKRIAMKWSDKSVYEGWCYTTPQGIPVTKDNYYYPGVETQEADPSSILNYYKASLALRNANPEIARGEIRILDQYYSQSGYICIMQRTWNGKTVTIAVNLDREWAHDITLEESLGKLSLSGQLCASSSAETVSYDTKSFKLHLPPYSIAVLR
ncbi:MAG: hypothetical protein IKR80_01555 [Spirochaetales bacterium]|nr:hypothetical protein [Spirochaetales bacterium]